MDNNLGSATESGITHFAMTPPRDSSVDARENRVIFQNKRATMEVASVSREFADVVFHIGGLDDPRIIMPLGADVTITFENQDGIHSHGWRLIKDTPPFANPHDAATKPLAFTGSEIAPLPPHGHGQAHFVANAPGVYTYVCPVSGDDGIGLYGEWEVSPSH